MGCIGSRDDAADNTQARKRNEEPSPLERIDLSQRPSKSALRRSNTFSIIRKRVSILEGEQARRASFSAAIGPSPTTASGGSASASSAAAADEPASSLVLTDVDSPLRKQVEFISPPPAEVESCSDDDDRKGVALRVCSIEDAGGGGREVTNGSVDAVTQPTAPEPANPLAAPQAPES
jgi:hypothetical protein